MANWASTSYVIEGSKEDVSKVYQVIEDFMNGRKKPVAETASDSWEGNIVKTLGASDEQMKKYLRGFIEYYDFDMPPTMPRVSILLIDFTSTLTSTTSLVMSISQ